MNRRRNLDVSKPAIAAAGALLAILAACSRRPGPAGGMVATPAVDPAANACVRDLGPRDLKAILGGSGVTVSEVAGNAEACRFEGRNSIAVVIGLRRGDEVGPFWKLALDAQGQTMVPMAGVGQAALRRPDGSEVIARQGLLSCQAVLVAPPAAHGRRVHGARGLKLASKLAALCHKVFAVRRA